MKQNSLEQRSMDGYEKTEAGQTVRKQVELVVIGGGSAGLAAAIAAKEQGVTEILVLEQGEEPGGVLLQCIHNGFGLHTFGEELTGPAYAERYVDRAEKLGIPIRTRTMALEIGPDRTVTYMNEEEGLVTVQAGAIVLAMGCRERAAGAISICGYRPSGVWTAGTAQRYLNLDGYLVGRRVFILGSGDIGMIMARRMTLEGAEVLGVAEVMPYSNGLPRNRRQCLEDFGIPLYLSHTVTRIEGEDRVEAVVIAQVDETRKPVPGTEKRFEADTLLLSVGLIPENGLTEQAGISLDPRTKGPCVSSQYETETEGIFACGNVLHVHDLVDFVSQEGEEAGRAAAEYVKQRRKSGKNVMENQLPVRAEGGLSYILPQRICTADFESGGELTFKFRVRQAWKTAVLEVYQGETRIASMKKKYLEPAIMGNVSIKKETLISRSLPLTFVLTEGGAS